MNIDIYCDGACSGNPWIGGRWAVIIYDDIIKQICWNQQNTTNNQMELQAVIKSISYIKNNILPKKLSQDIDNIYDEYFEVDNFWTKKELHKITQNIQINIYTDSKYVFGGITQYIKNRKQNWRKTTSRQAIKNQELWLELDFWNQIFLINRNWVKWHSNNKYNNLADKLATSQTIT